MTTFFLSALQRDVVHDQDDEQEQEDAEEARAIAEGIDNQLKELDDLDLEEEEDEEEDDGQYQQNLRHHQPAVPLPSGGATTEALHRQFKDKMFLADTDHHQHGPPPGQAGNDMLQILYDARGHQVITLIIIDKKLFV